MNDEMELNGSRWYPLVIFTQDVDNYEEPQSEQAILGRYLNPGPPEYDTGLVIT
jgi:hypothetical protein